jgi:hypothetical protein
MHTHHALAVATGLLAAAGAGAAPAPLSMPDRAVAVIEVTLRGQAARDSKQQARFLQAQVALIQSPAVLEAALARPGLADLACLKSRADPSRWLATRLKVQKVQAVQGTQLFRVSLGGCRPVEAVAILGAVIATAQDRAPLTREAQVLQAQLDRLREHQLLCRQLAAQGFVRGGMDRSDQEIERLQKALHEARALRIVQPARALR